MSKVPDDSDLKLREVRQEYSKLRADLMRFKKDKVGTYLDESNIEVQQKMTPL